MGTVIEIKGDLIALTQAGKVEALAHGCNCFCKMGAGFARQLARAFPEAYAADLATRPGDVGKLGTYTAIDNYQVTIFNLYTQYRYGLGENHFDIIAYKSALTQCIETCIELGIYNLHIPRIGSNLAGGDWSEIFMTTIDLLEQHFKDIDFLLTVVVWN